MKLIKGLFVWLGMVVIAVLTPLLWTMRYSVTIEAVRRTK